MMEWYKFKDRDFLESELVDKVRGALQNAIDERGSATLLVSGGSTPVGFFKTINELDLDWSKVLVSLVDERWSQNFRNESMVRDLLLQNKASEAKYVSLIQSEESEKSNLNEAQKATQAFIDNLDCVILGMGGDGHTASLFPNDNASVLAMQSNSTAGHLAMTNAPKDPIRRITFTLDAILKAKTIFLHIYGENKLEVLLSKNKELPITTVISKRKGHLATYYSA
ncbi:MAG: 6-phosphogluconolactonase [Flavobacteriales bacterium]|jgi:6-phosphogluconolactonase